jgi:hypothetical protein
VRHRLSNLQPFCPEGATLSEHSQFGMACGEPGTGVHGRQGDLPEALVAPCAIEGRHGLPETVEGLTIVALSMVSVAKVEVRQCRQNNLPTRCGGREGPLGGGNGLVMHAHDIEIVRQKDRDLSQATRIVEGFGEGLGLAQTVRMRPR